MTDAIGARGVHIFLRIKSIRGLTGGRAPSGGRTVRQTLHGHFMP
ncbi:hypothetical protein [Sinorhizobium mexicanum]|nr:hypothetical protein [Sinorhizobium mexicanum]MBP1887276.1 hypothetical protein [Sinorhizobium mexicanum]